MKNYLCYILLYMFSSLVAPNFVYRLRVLARGEDFQAVHA